LVIDPKIRAAVEAAPLSALLPPRAQSRAESLAGRATVLDALHLEGSVIGDSNEGDAFVLVVRVSGARDHRDLVVPGRVRDGIFVRDSGVASLIREGSFGDFSVDVVGSGIPIGKVRTIDVDQSNDSVIIGEEPGAVMVKWQLDAVESPAPQRLLMLAVSGLTPEVRGVVRWRDGSGVVRTIMTAADYVPGAVDGWTWAVELVRSHALGETVDAIRPFAVLGQMTARMHVVLSVAGVQMWNRQALVGVHGACRADLDEAVRLIDGDEGVRLRARADLIGERMDAVAEIDSTPVIPIHGDFHIGQVLRVVDGDSFGFAIVDFDGNPVLNPSERMKPQPAARDVAGMLASIDHVARVVNYRTEGLDPRPAAIWIPHAQDAFLAAYQGELGASGQRSLLDDRLLTPLMLDQECREFVYAARHLPHWRYVPDAVLTAIFPDATPLKEN
jgi:maltokinase